MWNRQVFIKNLEQLMSAHGIPNQRQLAIAAKISTVTINNWFKGRIKGIPDPIQIQKICSFFGVTQSQLFNDERPLMISKDIASYNKEISDDLADLSDEGKRKVAEYIRDLKTVEKVRALQESGFRGQCCIDKQQQKKGKKVARRKAAAS